jgi:multidrug efflux pump subunit AcrA (membrane-fusion protein)
MSHDPLGYTELEIQRRRAQNRAAQRAYRQRRDHSLKQREVEIESLRNELEKAQRLNKTLCKVVSVLRERLKETPGQSDGDLE